jgi:4-diphosphocytidyl-2-C-methyl-D-erythritol kinase
VLWRIAADLGADVPVCLVGEPRLAEGRGDRFDFPPVFPDLDAVLVNPGVPCPTGAVFRAYDDDGAPGGADTPEFPPPMDSAEQVARFLFTTRNDLEPPAVRLVPQVGEVLETLDREPESLIALMSGSGASFFALCWDERAARDLAARLRAVHPAWWVQSCRLKGFRP